ncbi:hypothetical protein QWJ34_23080 [Saccharibacillus sp. CPCC 101409]|uniref:hypothetical protein n=1 Tax=Saccharibacillus sp. CPCC 101409 TaxID=3058041 RepID=UPI0026737FC4|nr:hypothetical protein [Saccharibacillus sp. CPCC 101409]MDO3412669.1 hypothetical protein [Saccharibacillus sp. CPCC 101409]
MTDAQDRKSGKEELEQELSDLLTEGEMKDEDRERKEREQISPRYEIRTQTNLDPIVEETRLYRQMAEEIDDRYDDYLNKTRPKSSDSKTDGDK